MANDCIGILVFYCFVLKNGPNPSSYLFILVRFTMQRHIWQNKFLILYFPRLYLSEESFDDGCPIAYRLCPKHLKFLPKNEPFQNGQSLVTLYQSVEISPNLTTLVSLFISLLSLSKSLFPQRSRPKRKRDQKKEKIRNFFHQENDGKCLFGFLKQHDWKEEI